MFRSVTLASVTIVKMKEVWKSFSILTKLLAGTYYIYSEQGTAVFKRHRVYVLATSARVRHWVVYVRSRTMQLVVD